MTGNPGPRRALLVEPHGRGLAMARYGAGLAAALAGDFSLHHTAARHIEPRGLLASAAATRRDRTGLADAGVEFDLVHMTDIYMSPHCRRFKGARVVTVHDLMPREFRRRWPYRALIFAQVFERSRRHLKHADLVLTPSEYTRAQLLAAGPLPAERVRAVPPTFPPEMQPDANTTRGRGTIVSVGPAAYYKNFPLLLHALARPELRGARIIRAGRLRDEHRALAESLGVLDRIEETGFLSDAELIALFQRGAVLAQPSYSEGFGLPVAEAMLCGLPVVVSDGGALPEVAGSAGRVVHLRQRTPRRPVDWDDAKDFAVALAEVLEDDALRESMSVMGLREAERFRPGPVREHLMAAYETAFANAKTRNGA